VKYDGKTRLLKKRTKRLKAKILYFILQTSFGFFLKENIKKDRQDKMPVLQVTI
jgi:hypothetical protein